MDSGSVGLYIKGMLAREPFAVSRNYSSWEGQSLPDLGPKCQSMESAENKKIQSVRRACLKGGQRIQDGARFRPGYSTPNPSQDSTRGDVCHLLPPQPVNGSAGAK